MRIPQATPAALMLWCALSAPAATWKSTGGPEGGTISAMIAVDSVLLLGTSPGGIYRSTNNGESWSLVGRETRARYITGFARLGTILVAGSLAGGFEKYALSFSEDSGKTWYENPNQWGLMGVEKLTACNTSLFVKVQQGGLFRSDDTAKTWVYLEDRVPGGVFMNINDFAVSGDTIFAATNGGVMITHNNGEEWINISANLPDTALSDMFLRGNTVYSVAVDKRRIHVGARSAVFSRYRTGGQWNEQLRLPNDINVLALHSLDNLVVAGTYKHGIYRTRDWGETWNNVAKESLNPTCQVFLFSSNVLFAGTDGQLYSSLDTGITWQGCNSGIVSQKIFCLTSSRDTLYAGSWGAGISVRSGMVWDQSNKGLRNWSVKTMARQNGIVIAGEVGSGVFQRKNHEWQLLPAYLDTNCTTCLRHTRDCLFVDTVLYIGASGADGGLQHSKDTGRTLEIVPGSEDVRDVNALYYNAHENELVVGANRGIHTLNRTTGSFNGPHVSNLVRSLGGNDSYVFAGVWRGGLQRCRIDSHIWEKTSLVLPPTLPVKAIACRGDTVFAGTAGLGVFRSVDNGDTWEEFGEELRCPVVEALHIHENMLYAGTKGASVFEIPLQSSRAEQPGSGSLLSRPHLSVSYREGMLRIHSKTPANTPVRIAITNPMGKTVYSNDIHSPRTAIPMRVSPGVYAVSFRRGAGRVVRTIPMVR